MHKETEIPVRNQERASLLFDEMRQLDPTYAETHRDLIAETTFRPPVQMRTPPRRRKTIRRGWMDLSHKDD